MANLINSGETFGLDSTTPNKDILDVQIIRNADSAAEEDNTQFNLTENRCWLQFSISGIKKCNFFWSFFFSIVNFPLCLVNAICLSSKRWAKCYHSPLHSGDQFSHINKATLRFSMAPLFESIESHSDAIPLANTIGKFRFYRALNFCTTHTNTHKNAQTLEKKTTIVQKMTQRVNDSNMPPLKRMSTHLMIYGSAVDGKKNDSREIGKERVWYYSRARGIHHIDRLHHMITAALLTEKRGKKKKLEIHSFIPIPKEKDDLAHPFHEFRELYVRARTLDCVFKSKICHIPRVVSLCLLKKT